MIYEIVTRIIDIIVSIFAIVIFSPIMLITAILIMVDSKGPILADVPERVGRNYQPFKFYKFRSMVVSAHTMLKEDPRYSKLYKEYKKNSYKLKNDPRVTKVGKFIRKYSIDEFPQFFNILKGDMSLVGPRAYYFDELEYYISQNPEVEDDIAIITSIKPGLTGVWQISGRSEISFDKRIKIDLEYAKMRSIKRNVIILFKTPFAVFSKRGAY
jgi:lipopolysaccharide/colanic/teichoic acid biosynthesis glycosyltransferase